MVDSNQNKTDANTNTDPNSSLDKVNNEVKSNLAQIGGFGNSVPSKTQTQSSVAGFAVVKEPSKVNNPEQTAIEAKPETKPEIKLETKAETTPSQPSIKPESTQDLEKDKRTIPENVNSNPPLAQTTAKTENSSQVNSNNSIPVSANIQNTNQVNNPANPNLQINSPASVVNNVHTNLPTNNPNPSNFNQANVVTNQVNNQPNQAQANPNIVNLNVPDIPLSAIHPETIIKTPEIQNTRGNIQTFNQNFNSQPVQPIDPYAGLGDDNYNYAGYDQNFDFGYNPQQVQPDQPSGFVKLIQSGGGLFQIGLKFFKYHWKIIVVLITVISLLGVGWNLISNQIALQQNGDNNASFDNVKASIEAPVSLPQGLPGTWVITISNQELVAINNIRLELSFDQDFQYVSSVDKADNPNGNVYTISRLEGVGRGTSSTKITLTGTLNGALDKDTIMTGVVRYVPEPLLSSVRGQRQIVVAGAKTRIASSEIWLSITPTNGLVATGEQAEFTVLIRNSRETDFTDLQLRMIYPGGDAFRYDSSEYLAGNFAEPKRVPDNGDNIWNISRLPARAEHTLRVRGRVTGSDTARLTFGVELATKTDGINFKPVATTFKDIVISAQPLLLETFINGSSNLFNPGQTITVSITYQNQGREVLKNVEIFGYIDDPANLLDFSTLRFSGGERGGLNNQRVQWRGSNTPQLVNIAPGAKGELKYSVNVKKDFEFYRDFEAQEKYILSPQADARASNLQNFIVSGPTYKASGALVFEQARAVQLPTPSNFKANERLFQISWTLTSAQNRVEDVKVIASTPLLPTTWNQESVKPISMAERMSYNQFNGQIVWDVGTIEPYSGTNRDKIVVSFDLRVEFVGNETIRILNAPVVTGLDSFTGQNYRLSSSDVSVQLDRNR